MQFPVHTMQNLLLLKTVRYRLTLFALIVCVSIPFLSYAGIGAEPGNQVMTTASPSVQTVAAVPSYPGTSTNMNGTIFPAAAQTFSPYGEIPSYLQYNAQQLPYGTSPYGTSPYGTTMPYGTSPYGTTMPYGTLPQYGTYGSQLPYGTMSPYETVPGAQYPQTGYPQTGTIPGMNMPGYGGLPGTTPSTGDTSGYPLIYPTTPYDPMQAYQGGQSWGSYPPQAMTGAPYGNPYSYPQETADQLYNQGMQAYRSQDYWTALTNFQQVANRFPQGDLVDNAYYWSGEIYLAWKNYPMAIQAFQTVLYSYPNGNKVPDAHVKLGLAYMEMRQYQMARMILTDVSSRYADNKRIRDLATKKLNELNNLYYY